MCIIIDANKMGGFLTEPPNQAAAAAPIHDWLRKKGGKIVYSTGGKFAAEVRGRAQERLTLYARSGQAIQIDARRFQDDESSLANDGIKSDDPHVLALARESGARLLYTDDADLMDDFKDKRFIDKPRGKVYRNQTHVGLLTKSTCARVTAGD